MEADGMVAGCFFLRRGLLQGWRTARYVFWSFFFLSLFFRGLFWRALLLPFAKGNQRREDAGQAPACGGADGGFTFATCALWAECGRTRRLIAL